MQKGRAYRMCQASLGTLAGRERQRFRESITTSTRKEGRRSRKRLARHLQERVSRAATQGIARESTRLNSSRACESRVEKGGRRPFTAPRGAGPPRIIRSDTAHRDGGKGFQSMHFASLLSHST
ncbi:hypothetical protein IE53DRAFT_25958 [Violaceomyces palustris]|uniref:Uncharacterized protein n=1 Tax=Violaceomyces palustris TaxID=1673888 RepID=A0ACD0P1M5_9BASI|nr:hypothetical protein IE53DRAFT_25958 [Violaceomyces palustris]